MMHPPGAKRRPPSTLLNVHVRRDLARRYAGIDEVLGDLNGRIRERGGIILADGQILVQPIEPAWVLEEYYDDDNTSPWGHRRRRWGAAQARYFGRLWGVSNPFQFGEARPAYGRYCITIRAEGPYLAPGETILGLVDAGRDDRNYYCPCHFAEVVYTSARRLVCMACGHTHCVLLSPIALPGVHAWTEEQWHEAFDANGVLVDPDMSVPFVEYQDVHAARKIWRADAWEEVSSDIEFFARGDPEDIARWRAGAPTVEDFLEAGWSETPQAPTPARQMEDAGFGVDIAQNAAVATNDAAADFMKSQTQPVHLRSAVLNAFHAIELLLKIKLEMVDPTSNAARLTNPQVIAHLSASGVAIAPADLTVIEALRGLRNRLQHSGGRYGFRDTRVLLERAFVFMDRWTSEDLNWWLGEVVEPPAWDALLALPSIAATADRWSARLASDWKAADGLNSVEPCPHCARTTVLRERSRAGFCVYCRRIPVISGGGGYDR